MRHRTLGARHQLGEYGRGALDSLLLADELQPLDHRLLRQRLEAELGAARGDGGDQPRHVVADDAEARHLGAGSG